MAKYIDQKVLLEDIAAAEKSGGMGTVVARTLQLKNVRR